MIQRVFIQYRSKAINPLSSLSKRVEQFLDQQRNPMRETEIMGKDVYHSHLLNGSFVTMNVNHLNLLSSNDVKTILPIPLVHSILPTDVGLANDSINPSWAKDKINFDSLRCLGLDGKDTLIGLIDTGIDANHSEFIHQKENLKWFDPVDPTGKITDVIGHGTHCAGIMCGKTIGIAPRASLYATRSIDTTRFSTLEHIVKSYDVMFKGDTENPCVVNNSWGFNFLDDNVESMQPIRNAIEYLKKQGVANVFAIGNSGPYNNTILSPGGNTFLFSVGATDRNNVIAEFSSRGSEDGKKPDISAPDVDIMSSTLDNQFVEMSGTSM